MLTKQSEQNNAESGPPWLHSCSDLCSHIPFNILGSSTKTSQRCLLLPLSSGVERKLGQCLLPEPEEAHSLPSIHKQIRHSVVYLPFLCWQSKDRRPPPTLRAHQPASLDPSAPRANERTCLKKQGEQIGLLKNLQIKFKMVGVVILIPMYS